MNEKIQQLIEAAEKKTRHVFDKIEATEFENQRRVLEAFGAEGVSARHFNPSFGYGYDDIGRDTLDKVFARALEAQDALVRPQIASGTHAIFLALSGLLAPGDVMLAASGKPYDTLESAIGIDNAAPNSLVKNGVIYKQIELLQGGRLDIPSIICALKQGVRVLYIQRSRGYAWRSAISPEHIGECVSAVRSVSKDTVIVVDNCYGEFTALHEPTYYGADVIIGSLIKNPGGGIAPTGGYIAGKTEHIERIADRLTVPGMGREVGSYAGSYAPFYQGLFLAPHVTAQSLKTAVLFSGVFGMLGLSTMPAYDDERFDIVQSLRFNDKSSLIAFCQSIQKASPVDSFATPEPWDMPGYKHQVIMAAGAFVQGSSIELSADAPIKEPYTAYIQGGLTYAHGRLGVIYALERMLENGDIKL